MGGFDIHKLRKEGIRASETGLIHIEDAFVPDDCLLGGVEGTYPVIMECLSENRVGVAANALGMARAAFDAAQAYANDRIVANKRIGDDQAIAHKLADMSAQIGTTAQCLVDFHPEVTHLPPHPTSVGPAPP